MLIFINFPVSCLKWDETSRGTVTPRLVVVSKEGLHCIIELHGKDLLRRFVKGILHPSAILMKLKGKRGSLPYSKLHCSNCWLLKMRLQASMSLQTSMHNEAWGWQKWVKAVLLVREKKFDCELHYLDMMFSSTEVNKHANFWPLSPEIIWAEMWWI